MSEEKNTKLCSNCGAEIDIKAKICPKCGVKQLLVPEKVSNWWYVFAIFFGIIGSIIAWAVNKGRNPKKAIHFLIIGLVQLVLLVVSIFLIINLVPSPINLVPSPAEKRADGARIKSDMLQIRLLAEIVRGGYNTLSCAYPEVVFLCQSIATRSGKEPIIHSTQKDYCAYVKLPLENYYCIDSMGATRETSVYPGRTGYCDGRTFICP